VKDPVCVFLKILMNPLRIFIFIEIGRSG